MREKASGVAAGATFTPGPWAIWTGSSWRRIGSETTQTEVCTPIVCSTDGHPDLLFPNGAADGPDAHLIAAAPELYEALKAVMEQFNAGYFVRNTESDHKPDWAIRAARSVRTLAQAVQALAKAEGKS